MRQIATLPEEATARKFTDYLLTLKIATRLLPEPEGVGVWVCDEDRVAEARRELEAFTSRPDDARYSQAVPAAKQLRRREDRLEKDYRRRTTRLRDRMDGIGGAAGHPLTVALVTLSVLATLGSEWGKETSDVLQALSIAPFTTQGRFIEWDGLRAVASGELWRLVTPIFVHYNVMHLVFNALMLLSLGGRVEEVRGLPRTLALVLALAVASNVAEYYLQWDFRHSPPLYLEESPRFGGLSGVIYGLFGYAWMDGRFDPTSRFRLPPNTVVLMIGWFVLCALGVIANVANVAHGAGLLLGVVIGFAPSLWRNKPPADSAGGL